MIHLVGIGLNPRQITQEALDAIKKCKKIYLENYTSKYSEGELQFKAEKLSREKVEEDEWLIAEAKTHDVALLVYGNPLSATTHIQLLLDCRKAGVECKVIPGISIFDYLGATGLDQYKFGRVATVVYHEDNYAPESFYGIIEQNQKIGLHTLCLLDIKAEQNKMMPAKDAIEILEKIEMKRNLKIIKNSRLVVIAGAGSAKQIIISGNSEKMKKEKIDVFPQSLIVCGKLNEKENEALAAMCEKGN